jgi:hypothetical protein
MNLTSTYYQLIIINLLQIQINAQHIFAAWKTALSDRTFAFKILATPGLFFLYSAVTQPLGTYIQHRKGVQLDDKFLYFFHPCFILYILLLFFLNMIA